MTDIVERLRKVEDTICHEAAAEIEKLRDKLIGINTLLDDAERSVSWAIGIANE